MHGPARSPHFRSGPHPPDAPAPEPPSPSAIAAGGASDAAAPGGGGPAHDPLVSREYAEAVALAAPTKLLQGLHALHREASPLRQTFSLKGLVFELGPKWGVRSNGHICLSLPALTGPRGAKELFDFLQRLEPKLDNCRCAAASCRGGPGRAGGVGRCACG